METVAVAILVGAFALMSAAIVWDVAIAYSKQRESK